MVGPADAFLVGTLRTSTKKSIVQALPSAGSVTALAGMNSTSPVVGSGLPRVNEIPAHAVPVRPLAGPFTVKTPGSAEPGGHGAVDSPHDGVCLMLLSVVDALGEEMFVMEMLTAKLV